MPQFIITEENEVLNWEVLNWEVLLKTDEAIYKALDVLNRHNKFFDFDQRFLKSLVVWYTNPKYKKHFYSKKQYDAAFQILDKRYLKILDGFAGTDTEFNKFLNSIEVVDEEFVEVVDEIKNPMDCPVCDKPHKLSISEVKDFVALATGTATVKCDKCHQTITFLVEGVYNEE